MPCGATASPGRRRHRARVLRLHRARITVDSIATSAPELRREPHTRAHARDRGFDGGAGSPHHLGVRPPPASRVLGQGSDPHSPHLDDGPGVRAVVRGLVHAHLGWLFSDEYTEPRRWAPDMLKDPALVAIDRLFPLCGLLDVRAAATDRGLVTGTLEGARRRAVGIPRRACSSSTTSPEHQLDLSLLRQAALRERRLLDEQLGPVGHLFRGSWHQPPCLPSAAVHGIDRGQIDPTGGVIRALGKLGLARDIKQVSERQVAAKMAE